MPTISSGIMTESNFMNLKGIDFSEIRPEVFGLFVEGENPALTFLLNREYICWLPF